MMDRINQWILLVVISSTFCGGKELPSFIQRCKRAASPDNRNKCIMARVEDVRSHLIEGIPGVKLPPIDPFRIPNLEAQMGNADLGFTIQYTNIDLYGVKNFKADELELALEKQENLFLHIYVPYLWVRANYVAIGKLGRFVLDARGIENINLTEIRVKTNYKLSIVTRDSKEYVKFVGGSELEVTYATISMYLDDLVKNNKQLTEQTNKAINDNYAVIAKEIDQIIVQGINSVVYGIIKGFVEDYSLDELFE